MKDEILVGFGIDEAFVCHLAVTITSIVETAPRERFRFLIVHNGVNDDSRRKLESCAPFHHFEWHCAADQRLHGLKGRDYVSHATYYRLLLPSIAPANAQRLIYLDSDVVVCQSLRKLWDADLGEHAMGAVFDAGVDPDAFATRYELPKRRNGYFNAGVLLLNIERIRRDALFAPALDFLSACTDDPAFFDQDALNITLWDAWARLNPMWNVQRKLLLRSEGPCYPEDRDLPANRRPYIIHFTEKWKPWLPRTNHPYMWSYFRVARRTPFWHQIHAMSKARPVKLLKWRIKHAIFQLRPALAYQPRRSIENQYSELAHPHSPKPADNATTGIH